MRPLMSFVTSPGLAASVRPPVPAPHVDDEEPQSFRVNAEADLVATNVEVARIGLAASPRDAAAARGRVALDGSVRALSVAPRQLQELGDRRERPVYFERLPGHCPAISLLTALPDSTGPRSACSAAARSASVSSSGSIGARARASSAGWRGSTPFLVAVRLTSWRIPGAAALRSRCQAALRWSRSGAGRAAASGRR